MANETAYEITITTEFAAAHNLRGYEGSCERLHGHNWRVETSVGADELDNLGMVMDFRRLRDMAEEISARLDHNHVNLLPPFDEINPSAENIAKYYFDELARAVAERACGDGRGLRVTCVRVWESGRSMAAYHGR